MSYFSKTAATLVVSQTPGVGDYTSVDAAVAALTATGTGGRVLVREGTYAISNSTTMPDASIDIIGCGDATIFSLGNNANTPVFIIPDGLTEKRTYTFTNFKVTSNSRVGSSIVSIQDTNAFGVVTMRNVNADSLNEYIEITAGDAAFLTPVVVAVYDCFYIQTTTLFNQFGAPIRVGAVCDLVNDNGISNLMEVSFTNMKYMFDEFAAIGGSISGDSFGNLDISFYDCDLALASEEGLSTIHAERCRIWNFTGTPQIWFVNGNPVSNDYVPLTAFINCNVLGIWIIDGAGMNVTGGWWVNDRIETSANNGRSAMVGVAFHGDTGSAATFPVSAGVTAFFGHSGDISVEGCTFSATGGGITYYIDASSDFVIKGCSFRGLSNTSTAGIHFSGVNNFVIGDDFDTDNWGCPPIMETGVADRNVYDDCLGLNGNPNPLVGGTGVASVFIGLRNTFNGLSQFQGTAATTDAFVTVNTQLATSGVQGIGTIKNTGANSMTVRRTGVDQFGVTDTATTTVTAGNDMPLDPTVNIGTARPPYKSYMIEVQSTTPGNPTTYVIRLGMNGEVTW